jgi:sulfonate transport system substrate-binding protein
MEAMTAKIARLVVRGVAVLGIGLVAACSPAPTGTAAPPESGVLRIGPLATLNLLTLSQADGGMERSVEQASGSVEWSAPFAAFAPAAQAMTAGQIDMTSGSVTSLVTALETNPDLVAFAIERNDNDTQGIVAAPGTGVRTLQDLVGRTVAVNKGGTGEYLLLQALANAGIPADQVQRTYLQPQDAATAFSSGQVDAWATWDQYLAAARTTDGATVVTLAKDVGALNPTIHVVSRAFLTAHPDEVAAAYRALQAEADRAAADPNHLPQAYRSKGASEEVAAAIGAITPPRVAPADAAAAAEFASVAAFYQQQGLTATLVDTSRSTVDVTGPQ